jgi:adenosine deaminase
MRDLARLPKAHLHVHLESTVRPATLAELAAGYGVTVPDHPEVFTGFAAFAELNGLVRGCLRRPADFTRIAREFCADEAAQGTRYAEVTFTAASHGERLGEPELPLEAVLAGLAEGRADGIECRVLLDHPRRRPVERAWRTLGLARKYAADGVVGIGLAGEESHPVAPFAAVFAAARDAGLGIAHHAGEMAGPSSIQAALHAGLADRIGHGIRALEDPEVVAELRDRAIPLEVCPSSNVALGLAPSIQDHPLPRLRDAGLTVTLNTDIPSVTGATLSSEYALAREVFGYDDPVLAELARSAIDASFAPAELKAELHRGTDAWLTS